MKDEFNIYLKNIESTRGLALKFSKIISKSILICLDGELGTGKTTFARFLINFLAKKKKIKRFLAQHSQLFKYIISTN